MLLHMSLSNMHTQCNVCVDTVQHQQSTSVVQAHILSMPAVMCKMACTSASSLTRCRCFHTHSDGLTAVLDCCNSSIGLAVVICKRQQPQLCLCCMKLGVGHAIRGLQQLACAGYHAFYIRRMSSLLPHVCRIGRPAFGSACLAACLLAC